MALMAESAQTLPRCPPEWRGEPHAQEWDRPVACHRLNWSVMGPEPRAAVASGGGEGRRAPGRLPTLVTVSERVCHIGSRYPRLWVTASARRALVSWSHGVGRPAGPVAFRLAFVDRPAVVFRDEPTEGVDIEARQGFRNRGPTAAGTSWTARAPSTTSWRRRRWPPGVQPVTERERQVLLGVARRMTWPSWRPPCIGPPTRCAATGRRRFPSWAGRVRSGAP